MSDSDDIFLVERILKKRYNKKLKTTQFLVRWLGYSADADTWEREENIYDKVLIEVLNTEMLKNKMNKEERPTLSGFARGLTPVKIIGATNMNGRKQFLVTWAEKAVPELVYSEEANLRCPQKVIEYYEKHLVFHREKKAVKVEKKCI